MGSFWIMSSLTGMVEVNMKAGAFALIDIGLKRSWNKK
jgi:hypothetical protein